MLKPKPNPEQAKAEREVRKLTAEKSEASRNWFMRFQERSRLHHRKAQDEAASASAEAAASCPENPTYTANEWLLYTTDCFGKSIILIGG